MDKESDTQVIVAEQKPKELRCYQNEPLEEKWGEKEKKLQTKQKQQTDIPKKKDMDTGGGMHWCHLQPGPSWEDWTAHLYQSSFSHRRPLEWKIAIAPEQSSTYCT